VFVSLGWKSLLGTKTLTYYEKLINYYGQKSFLTCGYKAWLVFIQAQLCDKDFSYLVSIKRFWTKHFCCCCWPPQNKVLLGRNQNFSAWNGLNPSFKVKKTFFFLRHWLRGKISPLLSSSLSRWQQSRLDTNLQPGNTKGGSITVPLTSCLTGLH
jgi:hypothetical protein